MTGQGIYVFPGERSRDRPPLSDNSIRSALYALGFGKEQTWHGFRATARTMLVDELNLDPLVIEANIAHAVKDSSGRSYNRTQYLKQRSDMVRPAGLRLNKLVERFIPKFKHIHPIQKSDSLLHTPKARALYGNSARADLCGVQRATSFSTVTGNQE